MRHDYKKLFDCLTTLPAVSRQCSNKSLLLVALITILILSCSGKANAVPFEVVKSGGIVAPVVHRPGASAGVVSAAGKLATKLSAILGTTVPVITGDGSTGIAVGVGSDFSTWPFDGSHFSTTDSSRREEYALRSHADGVWVAGATDLAVTNAIWELLYQIGYRYYVPDPHWEIIPSQPELVIDIDKADSPDYLDRYVWAHYGYWSDTSAAYAEWKERNRVARGLTINSGHSYGGIIQRNLAELQAHPEYMAEVNGVRVSPTAGNAKFCLSNAGLRQLIVDDAVAQFTANPSLSSVSIDPSDGGGWCECSICAAYGAISTRQAKLANEVAAAIPSGKCVGFYAYNYHAPPPTVSVSANVVVNVATSFLPGGYTVDQLMAGWKGQGATIGVREYYAVWEWDHDLPGQPRGGNIPYLADTIPKFYNNGARFMNAESGTNWGPAMLGNNLQARALWDVGEAGNAAALRTDFIDKCFNGAQGPMNQFYTLIDSTSRPLLSSDLVGRMYGALQQALNAQVDTATSRRIYDLVLYTRYVELYYLYSTSADAARQAYFEELLNFSYRIRHHHMVSSYSLWREADNNDASVTTPTGCGFGVGESTNPCKQGGDHSDTEIEQFLVDGITNNPPLPWTPIQFSDDLIPATALSLTQPAGNGGFPTFRGGHTFYTWVEGPNLTSPIELRVGAGYITPSKPSHLDLYARENALGGIIDTIDVPVPPAGVLSDYSFDTAFEGLHRINVSDAKGGTKLTNTGTYPHPLTWTTFPGGLGSGRYTVYFYVPKGTAVVAGWSSGAASSTPNDAMFDSSNVMRHNFTNTPNGYFSVPVPAGEDGKVWRLSNAVGSKVLMTVPNYYARSVAELLLPREVVQADGPPAPALVIDTPTAAATYTTSSASISLSGTASSTLPLSSVNWNNSRGGSGTATGIANWSIGSVALQMGDNIITVSVSDYIGNITSDTITVTRTSPPPTIVIDTPVTGAAYETGASTMGLAGTAASTAGLTNITWSNDRGGSGTATGTDNWSAGGIALQPGNNVITVTAHDGAGGAANDTITISRWLPQTYTDTLVPATPLTLTGSGGGLPRIRGNHTFYTWATTTLSQMILRVKGGITYTNRGNVNVQVFAGANTSGTPMATFSVPPDQTDHDYTINFTVSGLHTITIADNMGGTQVSSPSGHPLTWEPYSTMSVNGRWTQYFYVPKNTTHVRGYNNRAVADGSQTIRDASNTVHYNCTQVGYFSIPVPTGQDGTAWKIYNHAGGIELMSVPNYISSEAGSLLLPEEVVLTDSP